MGTMLRRKTIPKARARGGDLREGGRQRDNLNGGQVSRLRMPSGDREGASSRGRKGDVRAGEGGRCQVGSGEGGRGVASQEQHKEVPGNGEGVGCCDTGERKVGRRVPGKGKRGKTGENGEVLEGREKMPGRAGGGGNVEGEGWESARHGRGGSGEWGGAQQGRERVRSRGWGVRKKEGRRKRARLRMPGGQVPGQG